MEMKLFDGDYIPDIWGGFETVSGGDELLQRVLYKLRCRRGGFAPMPELGSGLYLLAREKKENLETAARRYAAEALADEAGLELSEVHVSTGEDGGITVKLSLLYSGGELSAAVAV